MSKKNDRHDCEVHTDIENQSRKLLETLNATDTAMQDVYVRLANADDPKVYKAEIDAATTSYKRAAANMRRAYTQTLLLSDELSARWTDLAKSRKKHRLIPRAPANSSIDLEEERTAHFARGINIYKLLLICYVGSFIGVLVEMLWCLLSRGYIESRSGLVLGPFNLLYGVGGIAITAGLYWSRNKGKLLSFLGGFLIGSAVEYVCSVVLEVMFGSRSWDYSRMPFNINGRICLLYSVFWGLLGVWWVKLIYPRVAKLILRIPERAGKIATWVLLAFFIVNVILTILALARWSQRIGGTAAASAVGRLMDEWFPDSAMKRIFPNMKFGY